MSRCIKVAVCKSNLQYFTEYYRKSFKKQCSSVTLSLEELPDEVTEKEFRHLVSDIEIAVIEPWQAVKLSRYLTETTKWIHSTWAGFEFLQKLDDDTKHKISENRVLTRAGGVFGQQMAEYVIGAVIAMERNFPKMQRKQLNREWYHTQDVMSFRTLPTLSIGILGLGDIGTQVAKSCNALGMTVYGLKQTKVVCEHVKKVFLKNELPQFLQSCDYVCSILPSTPTTQKMLSGDILKNCAERNSKFINIGRGDVIDELSLINALNRGWISGAFLDVFENEPLDKKSPLWSMENVTITPHVSGCKDENIPRLFFKNLLKYLDNQNLDYVITLDE